MTEAANQRNVSGNMVFMFLPNVLDGTRPVDYYDLSSCNRIGQETTIERKRDRSGRWLWRLVGPFDFRSHLVAKRHHAALIAFDLRQMKGDISVELLEEGDPVTYQDRQDRITNFVG